MKKIRTIFAFALSLLLVFSCSALEHPDPSQDDDAPRLSTITAYTDPVTLSTLYSITYHKSGRVAEIKDYVSERTIRVQENPLRVSWEDNGGLYGGSLTDINCNDRGYMVSCTWTERIGSETESFKLKATYDSDGHLLTIGNMRLEWSDACLMRISDDDEFVARLEYDGEDNQQEQWVPWCVGELFYGMEMTGLFGKAPRQLIARIWGLGFDQPYSYTYHLNASGQISDMVIHLPEGGPTVPMYFNY